MIGATREEETKMEQEYIPIEECKPRYIYIVHGKDMTVSVYMGKGYFIGLSEADPKQYLHVERHCDILDPTKGTVYPQLEFDELPKNIEATPFFKNRFGFLWANDGDKLSPVKRTMLRTAEPRHGLRDGFEDIITTSWRRMPDHEYPFFVGNTNLYDHLSKYENPTTGEGLGP